MKNKHYSSYRLFMKLHYDIDVLFIIFAEIFAQDIKKTTFASQIYKPHTNIWLTK